MTTKKQAGVSSVALIPFWGPDQNINDQFEKEVYAAVKKMKGYSPVSVNTADIPIPYEIPARSLIGGYDYVLTGEVRKNMETTGLTAAHPSLSINSGTRIRNIANSEEVEVTITGRILPSAARKEEKITVVGLAQRGIATQEMKTTGLTAAHPSLPINSRALIENIANGKLVEVTITERILPSAARVVDLSSETALALDINRGGPVIITQILPDSTDPSFWNLRLYLWREDRLIFSDLLSGYDPEEIAKGLSGGMLEWLFSWTKRGNAKSPARNATVSSVALVPFWGSDENTIEQFGTELYAAVGNMKDFRPVRIDMTNLPDDVPVGGFPPFICPSPSLIKTNPYALTGELIPTDSGSLTLRLYLWEMADTRPVFTSTLTARNMSEYRLLLPGLLEKLFSQI
jgi:hypothetical protein